MTTGLPGLAGLDGLVELRAGTPVHIIAITDERGRPLGNNGDVLMHRVFEHYLVDRGLHRVRPEAAEALLLPPNGALLESYRFPRILASRLAALPDLPLYMFPSSALFETEDPAHIFGPREAPTTWILREAPSYHHLGERWEESLSRRNVRLALDHDIVASGHRWIRPSLDAERAEPRPIVAARTDAERATATTQAPPTSTRRPTARRLAGAAVTAVRRATPDSPARTRIERRLRARRRNQDLTRTLDTLARHLPGFDRSAWEGAFCADISRPDQATYAEYSTLLANAERVVTDRLHVGLPAAALGKKVFLLEGSYHKIRGVYERSLAKADNVTLISDYSG